MGPGGPGGPRGDGVVVVVVELQPGGFPSLATMETSQIEKCERSIQRKINIFKVLNKKCPTT